MHLFGFGRTVHTSVPTIIINSKTPLSIEVKLEMQKVIDFTVWSTRPWNRANIYNLALAPEIQLLLKISRLRRSVDLAYSDEISRPIYNPRNIRYNVLPQTRDSIGAMDCSDETVTLGCYFMLDDTIVALTVDHLLPQTCSSSVLTHVSHQDQRAFLVPILIRELCQILYETSHPCEICAPISTVDLKVLSEKDLWDSIEMFWPFGRTYGQISCLIETELAATIALATDEHKAEYLGPLLDRSFQRCVSSDPYSDRPKGMREMDWATYTITNEQLRGKLCGQSELYRSAPFSIELAVANAIQPGFLIKSVRRTSGYRVGQVSDTLSAVFHNSYITHEWSVIKRPETRVKDWVCGGIGVEGDAEKGHLATYENCAESVYLALPASEEQGDSTRDLSTAFEYLSTATDTLEAQSSTSL